MAALYACDGCKLALTKPIQVGSALKRDYCSGCAPEARKFLAAEEAEREQLCKKFSEARKQLIAAYSKEGTFKLPDVP
jgi:hypothetical protein